MMTAKAWPREQLGSTAIRQSECALRMSFETSEPAASDAPLPTRLHLLILTTHFHQLNAINMQAYGYHSHSDHHNVWLRIE